MLEFLWKTCTHNRVSLQSRAGYCPDCGEYVENRWYIARCKCCGVKHRTIIRSGHAVPIEHFCKNCGESEYIVEEIDYPDIVTVNYAALKRITTQREIPNVIQMWIDRNAVGEELKMLSAC